MTCFSPGTTGSGAGGSWPWLFSEGAEGLSSPSGQPAGFSLTSGVRTDFSGGSAAGKASREALGLRVPVPNSTLGLLGESPSSAGGLEGPFPEEARGLGVALGGGGRVGGAEVLWIDDAFFFRCSDPSLEVRLRRTNSGPGEGCSEATGAWPGDGSVEAEKTSSRDPLAAVAMGGEGRASAAGPLQDC